MSAIPRTVPGFSVDCDNESDSTILLAGFSEPGLGGLTAVDYLVKQLKLEQCGHLSVEGMPTITPFENGTPRHPIRLFTRPDIDLTILVSELIIPVFAADEFAAEVRSWTATVGIEEIVLLSGIPIAHAPEDHRTFYVATTDYHEHRLADAAVPAMANGYLDGVNASLVSGGIDSPLEVGVFLTPAHMQTPDAEAAVRLVETVADIYDLTVDTEPLEAFAAEVEDHYRELAERLEETDDEFLPEDRMYM